MLEKSISIIRKIYSWILPFTCILCERPSDRQQDLCNPCLQDLPILTQNCAICGIETLAAKICGPCTIKPPPFKSCYCLFEYSSSVTDMILSLKFQQKLANARILGELMAEKIQSEWYLEEALPDLLIPMPLHPQRLKERGFNQALEIARPIAKKLGRRLEINIVQRVKNTPAQMKLDADQRKKNIRGAFLVTGAVEGKSVAVIDDVMTTGFTVREIAKALLKSGAVEVDIWCAARTKKA